MASLTGAFISLWNLRPSAVRLLLRLGIDWTYSRYGLVRSLVTLPNVSVAVGRTVGVIPLAFSESVGVVVFEGDVELMATETLTVFTAVSHSVWGSGCQLRVRIET